MTSPARARLRIVLTDHARERARERFPGYKPARMADEVRAAFLAGRVGPRKPHTGGGESGVLYAWTADGERIFALRPGDNCFAVHTVFNTNDEREELS